MAQGLAGFVDTAPSEESLRDALLAGLSRPRKSVPSKFFYDERGSALFEDICNLPEYYPTRTEIGILESIADELAALIGPGCGLVEFGSGSSRKVRILLEALDRPRAYVPVDISREHLRRSAAELAAEFRDVAVVAVCADYTRPFRLPRLLVEDGAGRRVGFFPGSTIGNFDPAEAEDFLAGTRRLLGPDGMMIVGVDLKKDRATLEAAYDDRAGVTAEFNLNLLARANRELGADFDLDGFAHEAFYDERRGRIEMHLRSLRDQDVTIAGRRFAFAAGEAIHTENSYKYTVDEFRALARRAGYARCRTWTDSARLFSVNLLETGQG